MGTGLFDFDERRYVLRAGCESYVESTSRSRWSTA
jgi:hypothetical protein